MEIYNNILIFDTLESTNAHAFKIIEQQQTIEDFTVIVTQNQTAGKGQRGNTWLSEPQKNCLFSIILNPVHIPANNQFILSQTISVAILQTIQNYCNTVHIKWPNDIYVGSKKIAGILIENIIMGSHISKSVIGVGLNCNQTEFETTLPNPTSLAIETNTTYDYLHVITEIVSRTKELYNKLSNNRLHIEQCYDNALYQKNIVAPYIDANGLFEATIIGVEPSGKLIVKDTNSQIRSYNFKEIEFVKT